MVLIGIILRLLGELGLEIIIIRMQFNNLKYPSTGTGNDPGTEAGTVLETAYGNNNDAWTAPSTSADRTALGTQEAGTPSIDVGSTTGDAGNYAYASHSAASNQTGSTGAYHNAFTGATCDPGNNDAGTAYGAGCAARTGGNNPCAAGVAGKPLYK